MDISVYIPAFVALFVIIDPIGLAPLFVALTQGMDPRSGAAWRSGRRWSPSACCCFSGWPVRRC